MADLTPYIVQDLMDAIYVNVDNDPTSSTDSTQDEWVARLRLINRAIGHWKSQDVIWNELWTTYTHGTPVAVGNSIVTTITNYTNLPGGFLMFTDANNNISYMDIVKPVDVQAAVRAGSRRAYITGSAGSATVNFTFTLATGDQLIGQIMSLYYYKAPKKMAVAGDTPDMSDPEYIINYVSAKKNLFNGRSGIAQDYADDAQECLDNMRIRNEYVIPYGDNRLPDVDLIRDGDSIGL